MPESHPLDDVVYWRGILRTMAAALGRRFASRQDQAPLIDDLEAEGWIVLCAQGPGAPALRVKLRQAMLDALAKWLYGVTWDQAPRTLTCQVSLADADEVLEVEDPRARFEGRSAARQELARLWDVTTPRQRQALTLLAEADSPRLDPAVYQGHGFTPHTLHDDRVRLRQAGEALRSA
jgi:hypothetical protein